MSALEISGKNKRPLIYCANHSSWWDVPVIIYLTYDLLNSDSYCLMEKKQFDVHPYFKGIGAVPIVREDPKDAVRVLAECTDYLNNTGKSLWIFPQGEIIPNGRRPVHFYSGVSHLLEKLKDQSLYVLIWISDFRAINFRKFMRISFTLILKWIYPKRKEVTLPGSLLKCMKSRLIFLRVHLQMDL